MEAIMPEKRHELGKLLDTLSQQEVMARIPQFQQVEIQKMDGAAPKSADRITALVFNIQQGVHCSAMIDFLKDSPDIQPFDIILANELDDGCTRSGKQDISMEIAQALQMNYAFALEFIELRDHDAPKAYHGNALFSRHSIKWAKVLHLPEEYNWYHDRQKRIGARCAVFALLDVGGKPLGVVSVHLENRTSGEGRLRQMIAIYEEANRLFGDAPVLLGGDLNTNAFDGRDTDEIQYLAKNAQELRRRLNNLAKYEPLLSAAEEYGFEYRKSSVTGATRRKPMPDGSTLEIRLDWFMSRRLTAMQTRNVSTLKKDCGFAAAASALGCLEVDEISDHNALWAQYTFNRP